MRAMFTIFAACAIGCANPARPSCETSISPVTIDGTPRMSVKFGTAALTIAWNVNTPPQDSGLRVLSVYLSENGNACPSNWIDQDAVLANDLSLIWIGVQVPVDGPYVGSFVTYASFGGGTPNVLSVGSPFIAKAAYPRGVDVEYAPPTMTVYASGTINITKYVEDVEVAGTVSGTFDDGSTIDAPFDVAVCNPSCQAH